MAANKRFRARMAFTQVAVTANFSLSHKPEARGRVRVRGSRFVLRLHPLTPTLSSFPGRGGKCSGDVKMPLPGGEKGLKPLALREREKRLACKFLF